MTTIIRGGAVVTESATFVADLKVDGERIVAIGSDLGVLDGDEVVEAQGLFLLPGGIDVHTHLDMPVGEDISTCDDFYTGHRAAAFGGTTTHIDFANQTRGESLRLTLDKER